MQLEEYIQITKYEFLYLFDEYGFKVVFREEEESQGLGRGGDAFGLESDMYTMRILFSTRGGGDAIHFGPLSVSFDADPAFAYVGGWPEWVGLPNLLWYLNRQRIDWSELERAKKKDLFGKETERVYFRIQSRLLKPHCPRIFEMFNSPEAIAAWKPEYEAFIHKGVRENPRYKALFTAKPRGHGKSSQDN